MTLTRLTARASRRLTALTAAGALALAGLAASAAPARANDDLIRFLLGAAAVGIIISAIDNNARAQPGTVRPGELPGVCLETIRVGRRTAEVYNGQCLSRSGVHNLPARCEVSLRTDRGQRRGYEASCLYEAGYRPQAVHRPQPQPPVVQPGRPGRPWGHAPHANRLPQNCEMTYRLGRQRVDGYDAACLTRAGFTNLPRNCRVTSTDGQHIYTASCLFDAGYRRR